MGGLSFICWMMVLRLDTEDLSTVCTIWEGRILTRSLVQLHQGICSLRQGSGMSLVFFKGLEALVCTLQLEGRGEYNSCSWHVIAFTNVTKDTSKTTVHYPSRSEICEFFLIRPVRSGFWVLLSHRENDMSKSFIMLTVMWKITRTGTVCGTYATLSSMMNKNVLISVPNPQNKIYV